MSLPISVGQEYHEGNKLRATLEWLDRRAGDPFRSCEVLVGDTLQRHNLVADGVTPSAAWAQTWRAGTEWIERNQGLLEEVSIPLTVMRWDQWLYDPGFEPRLATLERLLAHSPEFVALLDQDSEAILDRRRRRGETIEDADRALTACRSFLLEEIAVDSLRGSIAPLADLYPGSEWPVEQWVRTGGVPGVSAGLSALWFGRISFHRRRQPVDEGELVAG